jgi:serine/threonine-protein phosphatase PGAM5
MPRGGMSLRAAFLLGALLAGAAHADEPRAARTIVLMRHGHYSQDPAGEPELGSPLTPLGVAQAHLTAARLAGQPQKIDAVYASPLARARDTARVIAADLPGTKVETEDDLAECTPTTGAPDPRGAQAECAKKLDAVFARHFRPASGAARRELVVCHGNVIRYLVAKSLGVDTRAWPAMSFPHASLTTVRIEADGRIQVLGAGDVGHLPPSLTTSASTDRDVVVRAP